MGEYFATVSWTRQSGETFTDNRSSRAHQWAFHHDRYIANSVTTKVEVEPA